MPKSLEPDRRAVAALRAGSVAARETLARAAAGMSVRELLAAARTDAIPPDADRWLIGELARVIAWQDLKPGDRADALALFAAVPGTHPGDHAQLAFATGDHDRARELLPAAPAPIAAALRLDLGDVDWAPAFNALLPSPGLTIADGSGPRFDRIVSGSAQRVGDPERITTVVTTYRPGPPLLTAVRSLIAQTWTNHEILVIDDGSPDGYADVLGHAAALDPRVRIIRMRHHAGTYGARNTGLDAATGDYVTFQDSDDWSHPLRLERQVAPLRANPDLFGSTSAAIRVTEDLRVSRLGHPDVRSAAVSSLMFRRRLGLRRLGRFDPIRAGADAEFAERARAVFGPAAIGHRGDEPLALIRLRPGSLAHADDRPGWMHPARRSYRSAFQAWHRHVAAGAADPTRVRAFAVPRRLTGGATGTQAYDVVLAGDWTRPAETALGRFRALTARGLRAALLHLDTLAHLQAGLHNLDLDLQDRINAGEVAQVELCDDVHARLVVATGPEVLRHAPDEDSHLRADRVVIEATTAGAGAAPTDGPDSGRNATRAARRLFGPEPLWAPAGPDGRQQLSATPGGLALAPVDLPATVDADAWRLDRRGPRADRPVIGRHCLGDASEWQRLRDQLPDSSRIDLRLLDGSGTARRAFGRFGPPRRWLVYTAADLSLRSFLYQVDFYLHLPAEPEPADPHPVVLSALAAGCVVLLPHRFANTFGEAAVYCTAEEVEDTVRRLHERRPALREQSERGREFVRQRHGHDRFADRAATLVAGT